MMSSGTRAVVYRLVKWVDITASGLVIPIYLAARWSPQVTLPPWAQWIVNWLQVNGFPLAMGLVGVSLVTRLRRFITPPVTARLIHTILTFQQKRTFQDEAEIAYEHRVTLFLVKRWAWVARRWPWSGWLVPVERSGSMMRKSRSCFRVALNNPQKHEGIAGNAWAKQSKVVVENLEDLQDPDNPPTEAMIKEYAKNTLVTPEWVRKRVREGKLLARSYYGHPVEINGIIVGVIVVDSRNPKAKTSRKYSESYKLVAALLGEVLQKGVDHGQ